MTFCLADIYINQLIKEICLETGMSVGRVKTGKRIHDTDDEDE